MAQSRAEGLEADETADVNGAARMDIDRPAGVVGTALDAGPTIHEDANGQRRIAPGSERTPDAPRAL